MSIRTRLFALVLAILVPGLLGALLGLNLLYQQQKNAAARNLTEIARGLAAVIERELARREATLKTLAIAPSLQAGDLATFYEFAKATSPTADSAIVLIDLESQQLLNTRVPFGAALPRSNAFDDLRAGAAAGETIVSDLYFAPIGQKHSFALQVPVLRHNRLAGYLAMGSYAESLQKALDEQKLPKDWNVAVLDRKGIVMARRIRPAEFVGKPATGELIARMRSEREGVFEGVRLDGVNVFTAYTPIALSGWTLTMSMPKAEIDAQITSALKVTVLITALLLILALFAAVYVSATIARPLRDLVSVAAAVGRGEAVVVPGDGLTETRMVANELKQASERIRTANELMEQRIAEAIAENKRAQEALLQNQKLEALGKLTGGIAHDFNNLLQTISAAVEVALRLAVVDAVKTAMQSAKRAVARATKLTRQLTTFGRGSVSAPAVLDLRSHMNEFRDLIEGALRGDITVRYEMAPNLWPVYVDPVQGELAMLNAALNARDAMPQGGELEIRATNEALKAGEVADLPAGDYVRIRIRDTGVGIAAPDLPRVFEPFYTTKAVGKGSGLGLAQIYGFARQSGGTAQIESTPESGTTLTLFLPRTYHPVERREEERESPVFEPGVPRKVLFVEDDELVSEVMVPGLRSGGFEVLTAIDVASALQVLRTHDVDVVLSDIVMPGEGDGFFLAEEIRKSYPDLPIVFATGYSDALTAASPFRILLKPYKLDDAMAALEHEIRFARFRRAAR